LNYDKEQDALNQKILIGRLQGELDEAKQQARYFE
jgi:hypothetical protein